MKLLYYGDRISPNLTKTPEGYLVCQNVPIGRTGSMEYLASELGLQDVDPNEIISVCRLEEDVFSPETLASFEGKPVTQEHPPENVELHNYSNYQCGHMQNVRRGIGAESCMILADLHITDPALIRAIENRELREVSCGYSCHYIEDGSGGYVQKGIRGNHVAVVREGRAGKLVAIKDEASTVGRERSRNMKKTKMERVLNLFARSVRDAKSAEEIDEAVQDAVGTLDSTAEGEPVADSPCPVKDEGVETSLLAAVKELTEAVQSLKVELANDAEPAQEKSLDALISELETGDVDPAENEAAVTVPAEKAETMKAILQDMKPVIAAITDPQERKTVVDALYHSVKTQSGGAARLLQATQSAAQKSAADSGAPAFDLDALQARYDALNRHNRKGE